MIPSADQQAIQQAHMQLTMQALDQQRAFVAEQTRMLREGQQQQAEQMAQIVQILGSKMERLEQATHDNIDDILTLQTQLQTRPETQQPPQQR